MEVIIHIGVHKTATTWLQQKLFSIHPDIHLANNFMEPWNDELISCLINPSVSFCPENCRKIFQKKIKKNKIIVISTEEFVGHPYTGGYNRKDIAKRLVQVFPDAKILITIRNQADIFYSLYQQLVKMGYLGSINQMLNEDFWIRPNFKNEFFDYYSIYKLYEGLFKERNVFVFAQEQLKSNSKLFIKDVCDCLKVESDKYKIDAKPIAKSLSEKKVNAIKFMNQFRKSEYNPYPIFQINNKLIRKIMTKALSLKPWGTQQKMIYEKFHKNQIYDFFKESNENLFNEVLIKVENKKCYY